MKTNNLTISNESKLTIFGGVNVIESDDLLFEVADKFVQLSEKHSFNYVFKASFDKANRTQQLSHLLHQCNIILIVHV